jgi:hypothetical protein
VPAERACGAAREKEQRHDLDDPGDRGDRGELAEEVADAQSAGVDGGEQQRAMPEHDDDERGNADDIDSAVAAGRGVVGDPARVGHGLSERHDASMPDRGTSRMSSTTR